MSKLSATSTVVLNNGLHMPVFGLGTWRSEPLKVQNATEVALGCGYVHIDAAYCYENQVEVGQGLKNSKVPREKIFITSKLWNTHHKPEHARQELEQTLQELGVDYLDQYLIHWPFSFQYDESNRFPTDENGHILIDSSNDLKDTWAVLEEAYEKGLCRSIGLSNCNIEQIEYIMKNAKVKPAVNQIELHPYFHNSQVVDYCRKNGIHIVGYSPLGNFDPSSSNPSPIKDEAIQNLAKKYSKSPAQIIIRWHLQSGYTVIPKSVTPSRIKENSEVFDFELSDEDMETINSLGKKNLRMCNPRFRPNNELAWPGESSSF